MLTFSATNLPSWASLAAGTGRITGTPGGADVGTHSGIRLSVTDGSASASLPAFSITVTAQNSPPTISGSPATQVTQDTPYAFQPSASDPDGDSLVFTIANRPVWATFDTATGLLSGLPTAADVGTYSNILISVSDGVGSVQLPAFGVSVVPSANGSATLTWVPPTENTDGTQLTDLAGYVVRWGTTSGTYQTGSATINNPGVSTYVVGNLLSGTTYYFAVTAINQQGMESGFSNEASKTIP